MASWGRGRAAWRDLVLGGKRLARLELQRGPVALTGNQGEAGREGQRAVTASVATEHGGSFRAGLQKCQPQNGFTLFLGQLSYRQTGSQGLR